MTAAATHPDVVTTKFRRQVDQLQQEAARFRSLGVFLLEHDEPTVLIGFAAPQVKPSPLLFAMLVDYTDFDLQAPSVRFVDPFTGTPYTAAQMPTMMMRAVDQPLPPGLPAGMQGLLAAAAPNGAPENAGADGAPPVMMMRGAQPLLAAYGPDDIPFLCLAGVREYHAHPGHSGDPWELHRTTGAGTLTRLVEVVRTYAVEPVTGYSVQLVPQITVDFGQAPP